MASVIVTGGAGFLGSHVAEQLVRAGHDVVVLDDLSGGFRRNVPEGCSLVEGSVVDHERVAALFRRHRFELVFHLAAYAAEALSHHVRRFNYTTNVIGSVNLINEAIRHRSRCFVFASSAAVYGNAAPPYREDDAPIPADPYGVAKLAVEQDLRAARALFGLDHVILRPHNVYGERQNLRDPYRNVVGIFMNQALRGRPCTIFGDGSQTRAFSYIGDVAPAVARSPDVPAARNRTLNIGSDRRTTVRELARLVQRALGVDVGIEHLPARHECQDVHADHSRARDALALGDDTPLEEGLRRMAAWARGIDIRMVEPRWEIEVERDLPASWQRGVRPVDG